MTAVSVGAMCSSWTAVTCGCRDVYVVGCEQRPVEPYMVHTACWQLCGQRCGCCMLEEPGMDMDAHARVSRSNLVHDVKVSGS